MAYTVVSPKNSFIQFDENSTVSNCGRNSFTPCLPVVNDDDVAFQFIVRGDTAGEADALCTLANDLIVVGIVENCGDANLIAFPGKPERAGKINTTDVLYYWGDGLPDFATVISILECFHITISVDGGPLFCSNCLQRVEDTCLTSVVEYGGDQNQFGFDYCGGLDGADSDTTTCEPTIVTFTNVGTLAIPYTAQLQAKYGNVPTVSTWIYDDDGELVQMGIREAFDAFPPSVININFGGVASGIVKIS